MLVGNDSDPAHPAPAARAVGRLLAAVAGVVALAAAGMTARPATAEDDPVARDVAAEVGLVYPGGAPRQSYGKSPIFDHDGDGHLDVLLSSHLQAWPLMRNQGDGTFREVLPGAFFAADRHSCVAGDFGSVGGTGKPDGQADVYCVTGACKGKCPGPNHLFLQRPDRTFAEVGAAWGVADPLRPARDTAALDFDRDGLLDLAVANTTPSAVPSPNRLYRNVGGRFELVAGSPVNGEVSSVSVVAGDVDGDGWVDLVFGGKGHVTLYRNQRGDFRDASAGLPRSVRRNAWEVRLADLNGDGRLDLLRVQARGLDLWLNRGQGRFPAEPSFSYPLRRGRGVAAGDVNLDGKPDLYVVQAENAAHDDVMLLNDGTGAGFRELPIPQIREGSGDAVEVFPDWRGTGRAAFLVTNGDLKNPGPVQLMAFSAR